jgi:predicted transcriptional regulator
VKQKITVHLDRETVRKVKILAARRKTSISGLIAEQVDLLIGRDEAYEIAERLALALLDRGFHLGGRHGGDRASLHER